MWGFFLDFLTKETQFCIERIYCRNSEAGCLILLEFLTGVERGRPRLNYCPLFGLLSNGKLSHDQGDHCDT